MLLALALALVTHDAAAARRGDRDLISADDAAAIVRQQSGGRVLGVRPANGRNASVYRVKVLLSGGRVKIYRVDGRSGKILK